MATENSNYATPVESVGAADDALNVTAVENSAAEVETSSQNDVELAAAEVAADFAEEDAALAAEQAGLAIEGETAEEEAAADIDRGDVNGKSNPMIMGCYGIGVGRAMASVIEQSCDEYGPIWPISIAPWQVEVVAIGYDKEDVKTAADKIYSDLQAAGVEVLFDDRGEKPGFMFSDADLLGIPFRVVVSPKTLAENAVEFRRRDCRDAERIALDAVNTVVTDAVKKEMDLYR